MNSDNVALGFMGALLFFLGICTHGAFHDFYDPRQDSEQIVLKGNLISYTDNGTLKNHNFWLLKFEGGQEVNILSGPVPLYVGQYQELICEKDREDHLVMLRNHCPAYETAYAKR